MDRILGVHTYRYINVHYSGLVCSEKFHKLFNFQFQVWRDYFPAVDAIVFLVDVCDRDRFVESKAELDSLLTDEQLANCPILILGNKIDRPGACSEEELRQGFGLYGQTTGKGKVSRSELHGRPLELFMCSVLKRQGYGEGLRWIGQYLD